MAWSVDGPALRRELAIRGLSGADLARLAKVSPPTVTQAVHGRPISPRTLRAIADVLENTAVLPGTARLIAAASGEMPTRPTESGQNEKPAQQLPPRPKQ